MERRPFLSTDGTGVEEGTESCRKVDTQWLLGKLCCTGSGLSQVYFLCHTFLHVARVKKHMVMRESHTFRVRFSHGRVFFVSRAILAWPCVFDSPDVQKRGTKYDTSGLLGSLPSDAGPRSSSGDLRIIKAKF